jgi:protein TonB
MPGATLEGAVSGPLAPALAVSIALHAAALAGLPELWTASEPPAPAPLTALLVPGLQPAAAAAPAPTANPEPPAPRPPRPGAAKRAPPMPAVASARAREVPAPAVPEPAPAERVSAAASASGAEEKGAAPAPAPATAPAAPDEPSGQGSPDVGSLAQYRLALIGVAKEHKTYPPRAIDRGLEGRVDVRLVVGADGAPARVVVQRSSRHDVLDREALALLRKAAALTPVPPALRNREFAVEVPVLYELENAR